VVRPKRTGMEIMDSGIGGRTAFVTGAAGGIGARTAAMLAYEGVRVAIGDIQEETAEAEAARLRGLGHDAIAVRVDVSSAASVEAAVAHIGEALGSVDILVNNAGFTRDMRITRMHEGDW